MHDYLTAMIVAMTQAAARTAAMIAMLHLNKQIALMVHKRMLFVTFHIMIWARANILVEQMRHLQVNHTVVTEYTIA